MHKILTHRVQPETSHLFFIRPGANDLGGRMFGNEGSCYYSSRCLHCFGWTKHPIRVFACSRDCLDRAREQLVRRQGFGTVCPPSPQPCPSHCCTSAVHFSGACWGVPGCCSVVVHGVPFMEDISLPPDYRRNDCMRKWPRHDDDWRCGLIINGLMINHHHNSSFPYSFILFLSFFFLKDSLSVLSSSPPCLFGTPCLKRQNPWIWQVMI